MYKPFSSGSKADDLVDWPGKIVALGEAIALLSFCANSHRAEAIEHVGERLGMIISDYARAVEHYIEQAYPAILKHFEQEEAPTVPAGDVEASR